MKLSEPLLARNLAALRSRDPRLAARLELPVESDHVLLDAPGGPAYRLHQSVLPLAVPDERCRAALESAAAGAPFVFGVGLGELAAAALERGGPTGPPVVAWDRDPWLWRVALATHDWSAELASGRLVPLLGADLAARAGTRPAACEHPLLAAVYARERELLARPRAERRALLCAGGLFVDQVGAALSRRGFGLYTLDVERLAVEELDHAVRALDPELVLSINYRDGLAEFCRERGRRLLCWEVDPCTTFLAPVTGGAGDARVFTYRRPHVRAFREAGFEHVEYLPLAADPEARAPVALTPEEAERYGAPVSFVGTSMALSAAPFARRFAACWAAWRPGTDPAEIGSALTAILERQRADPWRSRVAELLEERAPGLRAAMKAAGGEDPAVLAGELAASERRLAAVARLARFGVQVWGDEGWRRLEAAGVRYRGLAGHAVELGRIYAGTTVNLDLGRLFQADIVTMRVFDVLAGGGFCLTERNAALEELFDPETDLATYSPAGSSGEELEAAVARFLADPGEARRRGERGRRAVLERHTVDARVEHMLARAGGAPRGEPWRRAAVRDRPTAEGGL